MFEEICLQCGKPVEYDGRAYCSDECESLDATSVSSSSCTSSAYPSPHLGAMSGPASDVPPLVPSALGTALENRGPRNRYSLSSIASSNYSSSVISDEEDDDQHNSAPVFGAEDDYAYLQDGTLGPYDGLATTKNGTISPMTSYLKGSSPALSYSRKPSTTNNRSMVPHLHRRVSSGSGSVSSSSKQGVAHSLPAPAIYPSDDDSLLSDTPSFAPRRKGSRDTKRRKEEHEDGAKSVKSSKRNRASLPAYFQLLQTAASPSSPSLHSRASVSKGSSVSSRYSASSLMTLARETPTTPTAPRAATKASFVVAAEERERARAEATVRRGRRRERAESVFDMDETDGAERSSSESRRSGSRSRSRSERRRRMSSFREGGVEAAMMKLTMGEGRGRDERERTESEGRRGRLRPEELGDGLVGWAPTVAPGLGSGRSGLRNRELRMVR